ncbi:MAG: protein-disulfide reductase DsbD N-terminal domain-containing protein [Candidatus Bipolaricaulota bacterium]|nr:protein-disulfide reductase DsbD N-terminal domain-containing protein [Candidatus Bipolaricaulota bacterium]
MKRLVAAGAGFLVLSFGAPSGPPAPAVVIPTPLVAVRRGGEILLALQVEVLDGWAIQAPVPTLPHLIPTSLAVEGGPGLGVGSVVYPDPVRKRMAFARRELSVLTGSVVLLVPVRVAPDAPLGLRTVRGTLTYQACTDEHCRLPEEVGVAWEVLVVP